MAHGAAVPGTASALIVLQELHRPGLGRAGHGDGPGVGKKGVERVEALAELALDVVDRVDQARVHLDLAPANDLDAAGLADAGLVVAVDVSAHCDFALLLLVVEQLFDVLRVLDRRSAAFDGAGYRARLDGRTLAAHVHLGRGAHEELIVAQIDDEGEGRGVAFADAPVEL